MRALVLAGMVLLATGCAYQRNALVEVQTNVSPDDAYLATLRTLRRNGYEGGAVDESARCVRVPAKLETSQWRSTALWPQHHDHLPNEIELCVDDAGNVRAHARGDDVEYVAERGDRNARILRDLRDEIDALMFAVFASTQSIRGHHETPASDSPGHAADDGLSLRARPADRAENR